MLIVIGYRVQIKHYTCTRIPRESDLNLLKFRNVNLKFDSFLQLPIDLKLQDPAQDDILSC